MDNLWQYEIQITLFLQQLGGWLVFPMKIFSTLGKEEFFMIVMPAIYWCIDSLLGLKIAFMLLLSNSINLIFKVSFHAPRPYWYSADVIPFLGEQSFGMPSGHAQIAASVWGLLINTLKQRWAQAVLFVVIFLIGFSRIYLGVHFTSDVLIGWLIGVFLVVGYIFFSPYLIKWIKQKTLSQKLIIAFIVSVFILALFFSISFSLSSWIMPQSWAENANRFFPSEPITPFSYDGLITTVGTLFGIAIGAAWLDHRFGRFSISSPKKILLVRYLVGLIGVLILWYGLGSIFPRNEDILSYSLRYLRYTLIGLWVSAGAPIIFVKLHLAQPFTRHSSLLC